MVGNKKTGILILIFSAIIAFIAGKEFLKLREPEPIVTRCYFYTKT